jgi:micrococcal nuclease
VEKIVDGDTFRVRHYPFYPLSIGSKYPGKLSESTISVRMYGVDCPELAHFGNPEQPYAKEASDYTRGMVDGKVVRIKLLRKDQYNRAVSKVTIKGMLPFSKSDVSLRLAEEGLATLYTGGGAEYDGKRELLESKIDSAKRRKRGMWKEGKKLETPAEYKKKNKAKQQTISNYAVAY